MLGVGEFDQDAGNAGIAQATVQATHAGRKSEDVVATLWQIADSPITVEFMEHFYQNLRDGNSPADALRAAKLALLDKGAFYWAPFVVVGL